MQPYKRQTFICSAIEQCRETVNCCAHKTAHIKDERCVPRECRYALDFGIIDCDLHDPEHPRVPIPEPIETRTVEQVMKEKIIEKVKEDIASIPGIELVGEVKVESVSAQEQDIKEAVKEAAQRPVTVKKESKKGKKGRS